MNLLLLYGYVEMMSFLKKLVSDERGVTAVEYAVVAAGVVAVVSVIFAKGGIVDETITGVFTDMQAAIDSIMAGGTGGGA